MPALAHDLLMLGDLHLGGSMRPPFDLRARREVVRLDTELARMIGHYTAHKSGTARQPRPWLLVLNGDCLDFLHMGLVPESLGGADPEEALYGLDFDESRSRWKLAWMAAYHRRSFEALCRFVEAGNALLFVAGNHDADLCFPAVQTDLRGHIARFARDPRAVKARIRFTEWFHHEPGRLWVEHGHRFDPYNTFPDPLDPMPAEAPERRLNPTFSHWGLRYFANRVHGFPLHDLEHWTLWQYLHWAWYKAGMGILRLLFVWAAFLTRYIRDTAKDRLKGRTNAVARARRRKRLRQLAAQAGLPVERLLGIDALHQPHVGASLGRLMLSLYVDRGLLLLGVFAVLAVGLPQVGSWLGAAGLAGLTAAAAIYAWRRFDAHRPQVDAHPVLGRVADRIGRLSGAPVVVFGHTHRPVLRRMGRTRWVNPGSWEHVGRRRPRCSPDGPCRCGSRFLIVTGQHHATQARLMAWCRIRRAPDEISKS